MYLCILVPSDANLYLSCFEAEVLNQKAFQKRFSITILHHLLLFFSVHFQPCIPSHAASLLCRSSINWWHLCTSYLVIG